MRVRCCRRTTFWRAGRNGGGCGASPLAAWKSADELVGGERQAVLSIAARQYFHLKVMLGFSRAIGLGYGDAVDLTRQIGQHCLRSDERTLCVDDPLGVAGQMDIVAEEGQATSSQATFFSPPGTDRLERRAISVTQQKTARASLFRQLRGSRCRMILGRRLTQDSGGAAAEGAGSTASALAG